MACYAEGDGRAFPLLFGRYKDRLYRYFRRMCNDEEVAAELCQDVWERVIRHRGRYDPSRRFSTYIFAIAHHRLVDHYRAQRGKALEGIDESTEIGGQACVERHAFSREQVARFKEVLDGLPAAQREVFLLHEETRMSLREMAEVIGVKPETAKSRLRFALRNLRKGMEGYL